MPELTPHGLDSVVHGTPTVEAAIDFIDALRESGDLTKDQGRLWKTAVRRIDSARQSDEPDDALWLLNNIEELAKRLVGADGGGRPTEASTRSYASRAASALKQFQMFRRNPIAFKERSERGTVPGPRTALRGQVMSCSLGHGRVFKYQVPKGGLTRNDVQRIAMNLWAQAEDFDGRPFNPSQLGLFDAPE